MRQTDPDTSRPEAYSKTRRTLLLVLVVVGAFVTLSLLAEGGVRIRQWLKHGQGFPGIEKLYQVDSETGLRIPVPNFQTSRISINSLGFRGPEIVRPKPKATIRIAFLGASTTFSAEASSNEATWPHLVVEQLGERWSDKKFDYVNAGVPGYTVGASLKNLQERVAPLDPDIIIIYLAANDLSLNSSKVAIRQGLEVERGDQSLSWLAEYSVLWYLVEKNLMVLKRQRVSDGDSSKLRVDLPALARPFKRDLFALVTAAQDVAEVVVLVTFTTRLRPEQDQKRRRESAVTALYYMPYMTPDNLILSHRAYNAVIREVASELGTVLIEDETMIPGDSIHFVDSVHFTDEGNGLMAKRVTAGLQNARVVERIQ